jgi:hypothetical protein
MQRHVVLSCTDNPLYSFYLPIIVKAWRLFGFEPVICLPHETRLNKSPELEQALHYTGDFIPVYIKSNTEQQVTYIQCSRLFVAAEIGYDDDVLITSDVDMLPLNGDYFTHELGGFHVFGSDLVQDNQYPICYLSATAAQWRESFQMDTQHTATDYINREIGHVKCDDMRGNYWFRDQETARKYIGENITSFARKLPTGKARGRLDRDQLHLFVSGVIDCHLPRPGYEDQNYSAIKKLLNKAFPGEFAWLDEYHKAFTTLYTADQIKS